MSSPSCPWFYSIPFHPPNWCQIIFLKNFSVTKVFFPLSPPSHPQLINTLATGNNLTDNKYNVILYLCALKHVLLLIKNHCTCIYWQATFLLQVLNKELSSHKNVLSLLIELTVTIWICLLNSMYIFIIGRIILNCLSLCLSLSLC